MWKVGSGAKVRIGMDPWVVCRWGHLLPSNLTDKLHFARVYFLKNIGCLGVSIMRDQGWQSEDNLGIVDQ